MSKTDTRTDPGDNTRVGREVTPRLPGRIGDVGATTFSSHRGLVNALLRAAIAHGEHEKRTGAEDPNWPDWYAAHMFAEQAGTELPGYLPSTQPTVQPRSILTHSDPVEGRLVSRYPGSAVAGNHPATSCGRRTRHP
ncbi:hypothetical protein FXW78_26090 [Rhodococcus opacus]|nr:hypothetical protein [Rhodococcus opacus]